MKTFENLKNYPEGHYLTLHVLVHVTHARTHAGRMRRVLKHHPAGLDTRLGMHEYFS